MVYKSISVAFGSFFTYQVKEATEFFGGLSATAIQGKKDDRLEISESINIVGLILHYYKHRFALWHQRKTVPLDV